jgi:endonuclease-3 related protein
MDAASSPFVDVYHVLLDYYGEQAWWPADDEFEVMVGAILTQNTAWSNVENAIANLKQQDACNPERLANIPLDQLAGLIRPSGYFNQKAQRLKNFASWYQQQGSYATLAAFSLPELRSRLLRLKGIGDETADDIVLYAFHKPSFVIDAYTRRIFSRLGLLQEKGPYAKLQKSFHDELSAETALFQQFHALVVAHAKRHCSKKPSCDGCPLIARCGYQHGG